MLRTEDGGATFEARGALPATDGTTPTDVFFTDTSTGFAVTRGSAGGKVYRTTNLRTRQSWTLPDSEHGCGGA